MKRWCKLCGGAVVARLQGNGGLKWIRASNWREVSDCGRYTVCASKTEGKFMFQAWRGSSPGELLMTDRDAEKCRQRASADAQERATDGGRE